MSTRSAEITQLLKACQGGDKQGVDELFPAVYAELRRIAHAKLARERGGHTLVTTDLVHEAYFKLVDHHAVEWQDRRHFFAVASRAMRQVLVDHARKSVAQKRGGKQQPVSLEDAGPVAVAQPERLLDLDQALEQLEQVDPRQGEVVICRFYAGYTIGETADILGVSISTVKRDWRTAKAWLARAMAA